MSTWFDQIATPLNACSVETYVPLLKEDYLVGRMARNDCDWDTATSSTHHLDSVTPLVIGCYQLNELSSEGTSPEADDIPQLNSTEDDSVDGDGVCVETSRSGELRLYMISSTTTKRSTLSTTNSLNKARANSDEPVRFGDASCIVKMESGVLDGKWRKRIIPNGTSCHSNCRKSMPLFASACASGKIHLHLLEKNKNTKTWNLAHMVSSGDQSSNEESSLCLSLAWNDFIDLDCGDDAPNIKSDQIASSYSNGKLALHRVSAEMRALSDETCDCVGENFHSSICIEEIHRWDAHRMFGCPSEVWTCSFLRDNVNVVLSGADDVRLFSVYNHESYINRRKSSTFNSRPFTLTFARVPLNCGTSDKLYGQCIKLVTRNSPPVSLLYPLILHAVTYLPLGVTTKLYVYTIKEKLIIRLRNFPLVEVFGELSGTRHLLEKSLLRPCMEAVVSLISVHWTARIPMIKLTLKSCPNLPHTKVWRTELIGYVLILSVTRWLLAVPFMIERHSFGIRTTSQRKRQSIHDN